jgi:hypothetical protein
MSSFRKPGTTKPVVYLTSVGRKTKIGQQAVRWDVEILVKLK